ncbi:hypothetical protein [Stutzerimonas nitrititolerans]|uniref:hypothetical protein n=1 Tax=Stutzerimonas nitrititolerans TaxID=2482751 RepID=UPI0028AFBE8A|nr:hypothetical protein [Stutzerimonas nitrititolerans]
MNLFDLRLTSFRVMEIKGESFNTSPDENPGYAGRFQADILSDITDIAVGGTVSARLAFMAREESEEDPFFSIAVAGHFEIMAETAIAEITGEHGSFQIATYLFPYLRNIAKPLLEQLGAAEVDFPLYLPPPPKTSPKRTTRRKTK